MYKYIVVALLGLILGVSAQAQTAEIKVKMEVRAGITPASALYFLDRFGEFVQEIFAFSPEAKVKLQIKLAAERVAEVKAVLEAKGVDAKGLDVALARLEAHKAKAAEVLASMSDQERKAELAVDLDADFEEQEDILEQVFEAEEDALEQEYEKAKADLKAQINAAKAEGNLELAVRLESELARLKIDFKAQEKALEEKHEAAEEVLEEEEEKIEQLQEEEERLREKEEERLENELEAREEELDDDED